MAEPGNLNRDRHRHDHASENTHEGTAVMSIGIFKISHSEDCGAADVDDDDAECTFAHEVGIGATSISQTNGVDDPIEDLRVRVHCNGNAIGMTAFAISSAAANVQVFSRDATFTCGESETHEYTLRDGVRAALQSTDLVTVPINGRPVYNLNETLKLKCTIC